MDRRPSLYISMVVLSLSPSVSRDQLQLQFLCLTCYICPYLNVMCNTSDVNRSRDHFEASSESLQSSPAAFPAHGLSAPTRTTTNGTYTASWPTTHSPCSDNWIPNFSSNPDSSTPSHSCNSHIKASPYNPTTQPRSTSNGPSSATEASTNGTHLGAPTCRSHTSNSASNR